MAGGNFFHRVLSYVANELIVNGLSNRHMFTLLLIGMFYTWTSKPMMTFPQNLENEIIDNLNISYQDAILS
ncbi:hypothetical protein M9H77_22696 [Catharanthus roseus]|uniref:Uncharacterized protein n=1 Tax=Catharanthus roseus TaxID=4058 RepID=A0ACC0AQX1_CATRO|nr:hypothetical protein M9H77_22696 [Catharanthus roseus]